MTDRREGLPFYRGCVRGELCVHLIYFAHLHFRAGSSLFMGWFPAHPPAYYCALNIDTLSLGTTPRPPKTLRCSARGRGQFVARTQGAMFAGNEYALFFANCPLLSCFGRMLCPLSVGTLFAQLVLFVSLLCRSPMREALPLALPASLLARGLTARFGSRTACCAYSASLAARHSPMHVNNYELCIMNYELFKYQFVTLRYARKYLRLRTRR